MHTIQCSGVLLPHPLLIRIPIHNSPGFPCVSMAASKQRIRNRSGRPLRWSIQIGHVSWHDQDATRHSHASAAKESKFRRGRVRGRGRLEVCTCQSYRGNAQPRDKHCPGPPDRRYHSIRSRLKSLRRNKFLDYAQPFRDMYYNVFELLGEIEVAWIPHHRHWRLSPAAYSDAGFDTAMYEIMSCPICSDIAPLWFFYECTHQCCVRCSEWNVQKTCPQCRRTRRRGEQTTKQKEFDERACQFNAVINNLWFQCPCTICEPVRYTKTKSTSCPRRFVCPLLGTHGCTFAGSRPRIREHLVEYHSMEKLWNEYRADVFTDRVKASIPSTWCEIDDLVAVLCKRT
jgi:hypothetical protein